VYGMQVARCGRGHTRVSDGGGPGNGGGVDDRSIHVVCLVQGSHSNASSAHPPCSRPALRCVTRDAAATMQVCAVVCIDGKGGVRLLE